MAEYTEFSIGQGETFRVLTQLRDNTNTPIDITNYTFSGQVRETYKSDQIEATFIFDKVSPFASGALYINLSQSVTVAMDDRSYVYDVMYTSGSYTRRILEGKFIVRPAVTR